MIDQHGFLLTETCGEHIRNCLQILRMYPEPADLLDIERRLESALAAYERENRSRRAELDSILAEQSRTAQTMRDAGAL